MARDSVVVEFVMVKRGKVVDLDIPLSMTANEFLTALNSAYQLNINTGNLKDCYFQCENPIALLRGNKMLADFGIRNGSRIYFTN